MKIKWNTPTKNTHAGIYLQMDAETLSSHTQFLGDEREFYWTSRTVHKIKKNIYSFYYHDFGGER